MLTVRAAEFGRHFGRYQAEARILPVVITHNGEHLR
jgi:hypothetical protein